MDFQALKRFVIFTLIVIFFTGIGTMTFLKSTLKADPKIKSIKPFYDLSINDINGDLIDLKSFKGKKIMLVNVASKCGYTDQYSDLQELYQTHSEKLEIIGIPCNDFGRQEPGSAEEIKSFCNVNYGVTFTLASKQKIKSKPISNLYEWLSNPELNGWNSALPSWNFCKYIIDEEGELIHFFRSGVNPNDSEILELL